MGYARISVRIHLFIHIPHPDHREKSLMARISVLCKGGTLR
jgi:hypothetical protein